MEIKNHTNNEIDRILDSTMPASDAPQFSQLNDRKNNVERIMKRLETLERKSLTSDQEENVKKAYAAYEDYKKGLVSESDVLAAMSAVIDHVRDRYPDSPFPNH